MSLLVAQDGAVGGFVLLFRWIAGGGLRGQQTGETRFPAPLVFGHFLLAAVGLVVWIVYLATDKAGPAWTSFGILGAVASSPSSPADCPSTAPPCRQDRTPRHRPNGSCRSPRLVVAHPLAAPEIGWS
ncbi:hypothetical protein ACFV16_02625 [Streptomyces massasporeus]|uniref:hypothetical protein n=1 Tax=Streptomyces massasporeus TaxID=67324 RepID=UPI003684BD6E